MSPLTPERLAQIRRYAEGPEPSTMAAYTILQLLDEVERLQVKPVAQTSANTTPQAGQLVTCCGDHYRLTHQHEGRWYGANLGPKGAGHTTMLCVVPRPFLFVREVQP